MIAHNSRNTSYSNGRPLSTCGRENFRRKQAVYLSQKRLRNKCQAPSVQCKFEIQLAIDPAIIQNTLIIYEIFAASNYPCLLKRPEKVRESVLNSFPKPGSHRREGCLYRVDQINVARKNSHPKRHPSVSTCEERD